MPFVSRVTLRVRYAETDQMGVVYHANYFIWFEIGRVELLRELGFSYKQMEEEDCHLPVVEAGCRYRAPALYDQSLVVETRIVLLRSSLVKFAYRLTRLDHPGANHLLAEAETTHLLVNRAMKKRRLPARYEEALREAVTETPRTLTRSDRAAVAS
ncbi:MAG TPA: thioesterase family protein [Acidisarcina sp.]